MTMFTEGRLGYTKGHRAIYGPRVSEQRYSDKNRKTDDG